MLSRGKEWIAIFGSLLVGLFVTDVHAAIKYGPRLSLVTTNSAVITWFTDNNSSGNKIIWGPVSSPTNEKVQDESSHAPSLGLWRHVVTLTGLSTRTEYSYKVSSDGVESPVYDFLTAVAPGEPFKFGFVADLHTVTSIGSRQLEHAIQNDVDFWLHAGDTLHEGEDTTDWEDYFALYNQFPNPYGVSKNFWASHAVYDNFSAHTAGWPAPYGGTEAYLFFNTLPDNGMPWSSGLYNPDLYRKEFTYAFGYGNVYFISLAPEKNVTGADYGDQAPWLAEQLQYATDQGYKFKVVFSHRMGYTVAGAVDTSFQQHIQPLLEQYHATLHFGGHYHSYNRCTKNGVSHILIGTGGGSRADSDANERPENEALYGCWVDKIFGGHAHAEVTVSGDTMTMEVIRSDEPRDVIDTVTWTGNSDPPATVYEVEEMTLAGGNVSSTSCACSSPSAGRCARNQGSVGAEATASMPFTGPGGAYKVDITYCDESDDSAAEDAYSLKVDGNERWSWTSSKGQGAGERWQIESPTVTLEPGNTLSLISTRGSSASWARLDKIELSATSTDCGNGTLDPGEACELGDTQSCVDGSGYAGSQQCNSACTGYAACISAEYCGDGIVQGNESCDEGALNGTVGHCNNACDGITANAVEAESMSLTNGNVSSTNCACADPSAGRCARNQGAVGSAATALMTYNGPSGAYRIDVIYCDESDDNGARDAYVLKINGAEQNNWFSSDGTGDGQIWQTESIVGVNLFAGDEIAVDSIRGSTRSWARVDKLEFSPGSTTCGNGVIDPGELCELGDSQACFDGVSGYGGSQQCNASCTAYTACEATEFCGDGEVQGYANEVCDDGDLNGTPDHCNSQCSGPTGTESTLYEAENLTLANGNVATSNCICADPSGGRCARNQASVGSVATASTDFAGPDGMYRVAVTYCDESDDDGAQDSYSVKINGVEQGSWLSTDGVGGGETWRTDSSIVTDLVDGDEISIESIRGGSASWARVDKLELIPSESACGNGELDPGEACDEGDLNGTVGHCNTQCSGITDVEPTLYEAEDLALANGNVDSSNCVCASPSAGRCARNQASVGSAATAEATHMGPPGDYTVAIAYCDESDDGGAQDSYVLKVNGVEQRRWMSSDGVGDGQTWQTESVPVTLELQDVLTIESVRGSAASWARIDKVEISADGSN